MSIARCLDPVIPGVSPAVYSTLDFKAIADIVYGISGNILSEGKAMLVYSRIAPLVREADCGTFANLITRIRDDEALRERCVAALTTNHTFFNREAHHFDHFAKTVRRPLLDRLNKGGAVRMWSAGCSSGEESWSLLMTLLGPERADGRRIARQDIILLASDLAAHAMERAEAATYPAKDVAAMPDALSRVWMRPDGDRLAVAPEMHALVRFRQLNLLGSWPMKCKFDVIFCRNVMIYFDNATKERLVARFAQYLQPGGYLYIGHSERVSGPAAGLFDIAGPTVYRRRAA